MTQTFTFHVHGMHCKSCVILTENELSDHERVDRVLADLNTCCVEVTGDFRGKSAGEVVAELSPLVEKHGYKLSLEKERKGVAWSEFSVAFPLSLGFMAFFIFLQKLGIVHMIGSGEITYSTAFLVGLIASVSTCMAVVGSLVLSVSANYAKEGDFVRPQILFHLGRLTSFFLLGGVVGALGGVLQLGAWGTIATTLIAALVMLVLGVNLLDVFPKAKRIQLTLPQFLSKYFLQIKKVNHSLTPVLLGIATFFLPCGFTQSMQVYALSTGNFVAGSMIMFVFALGTLPILALLSFSALSINGARSGVFFKTTGLIVIFFALFNLTNTLVMAGFISPVFNI